MEQSLTPTNWDEVASPVMGDDPRFAHDSKLYVQFYSRPVLQRGASEDAGRPIFADVTHVRIMVPGDKLSIIDRVASDQDVSRFPEHYAKYKQGQHQDVVGTRLEVVPWLSRSKVEEYKFFSILTVEQLAAASDSVGQKFPGFYGDRDKAIKFLEQTTGVNARMTELEETVKRLTEQLAVKNDAEKAYQDSKKEPSKKG